MLVQVTLLVLQMLLLSAVTVLCSGCGLLLLLAALLLLLKVLLHRFTKSATKTAAAMAVLPTISKLHLKAVGLVLFLVGVNVGFLPVGYEIGRYIGSLTDFSWVIVPIGMVIGFFVVAAEPAVHVLTEQVFEITSGAIPKSALRVSFMIGVSLSVGLAMLRILLKIDIMYILIPAYLLALILTFITPDVFCAVAFDSGGVASGAMAAGFVMPLAIGFNSALSGQSAFGFGVVALVAVTPLITIQILGVIYKIKFAKINKNQHQTEDSESIID